jgi:hypothetical protein
VAYTWGEPQIIQAINDMAGRVRALDQIDGAEEYCLALDLLMREAQATHYYTRSPRPGRCPAMQPVYQGQGQINIYARSEP